MKKIIFGLVLLGLTRLSFAQEKGVKFEKVLTWSQVKSKARLTNKCIFIDLYATWCGPCKAMDNMVFPSEKAGIFINEKFISVKVQTDRTLNDNEFVKSWYNDASSMANKYQVSAFPCLLFFSPEGKLISKEIGYRGVDDLIVSAKEAIIRLNNRNVEMKKFQDGKLTPLEVQKLAISIKETGEIDDAQKIADDYINNYLLKSKSIDSLNKEDMDFMSHFFGTSNSISFDFFMKQPEKVNQFLGKYFAEAKIMDFIDKKYLPQQNGWTESKPNWNLLEKNITAKFGHLGQEIVWAKRTLYYRDAQDWTNYGKYYRLYFTKALKHSIIHTNNMSWFVFQNVDDFEILKFAIEVMKYSLENNDQNNIEAYDTYANLLYKVGRTKEAIAWEEKVIKLKKGAPDEKLYTDALEKMRKGEKTWGLNANNL